MPRRPWGRGHLARDGRHGGRPSRRCGILPRRPWGRGHLARDGRHGGRPSQRCGILPRRRTIILHSAFCILHWLQVAVHGDLNVPEVELVRRDENLDALIFAAREADTDLVGLAPLEAATRTHVLHRGRPANHETAIGALRLEGREVDRVFGGVARVAARCLVNGRRLLALFQNRRPRHAEAPRLAVLGSDNDVRNRSRIDRSAHQGEGDCDSAAAMLRQFAEIDILPAQGSFRPLASENADFDGVLAAIRAPQFQPEPVRLARPLSRRVGYGQLASRRRIGLDGRLADYRRRIRGEGRNAQCAPHDAQCTMRNAEWRAFHGSFSTQPSF